MCARKARALFRLFLLLVITFVVMAVATPTLQYSTAWEKKTWKDGTRQAYVHVKIGGALPGQGHCTKKAVCTAQNVFYRRVTTVWKIQDYSDTCVGVRDDLLGTSRVTGESQMGTLCKYNLGCSHLCKGTRVYSHAGPAKHVENTLRGYGKCREHVSTTLSTGESRTGTLCKGMWVYPHADTGKRILCAGMAKTFSPRYAGTKPSLSKSFHPRRWIRSLRANRGMPVCTH